MKKFSKIGLVALIAFCALFVSCESVKGVVDDVKSALTFGTKVTYNLYNPSNNTPIGLLVVVYKDDAPVSIEVIGESVKKSYTVNKSNGGNTYSGHDKTNDCDCNITVFTNSTTVPPGIRKDTIRIQITPVSDTKKVESFYGDREVDDEREK